MKRIVKIVIFVLMIPVCVFGQTKNFVDEFGRKQGVHSEYSGSWQFERTYKNDTLNGFFRKFTKDGITWETGYFKNHLHDSLWLEFYEDGTVKAREIYKEGKKHGEFICYFENGRISYLATFRNDSLIGDATNYFENGAIKSKGNRQNGFWTEFYENGNTKSKEAFSNGQLWGQRYYFSINGDTLLPRLITPKFVSNDTSIINNTDLKVYLLFDSDSYESDTVDYFNRPIGFHFLDYIRICQNDFLTISAEATNFKINPAGLYVYQQIDTVCDRKIKLNGFASNFGVKEKKEHFKSRFGKIEVNRQQGCMDTGRNPITILQNEKTLLFKDIGNLIFFEFDGDNDGKNELYILNYFTCGGRLKIYRIDDK